MKLTDGEKLILTMLCDIHAHLKIQDSVDPEFILAALHDGRLSALKDKYTGIFAVTETPDDVVREVEDILWMWHLLERDYETLGADEQRRILSDAGAEGHNVRFPGFDGNNECDHLIAARFALDHQEKFERFKGRDLNSHAPLLETYRRMLVAFKATPFDAGRMGSSHITEVLKARQRR
jgi:uncharacterized protein